MAEFDPKKEAADLAKRKALEKKVTDKTATPEDIARLNALYNIQDKQNKAGAEASAARPYKKGGSIRGHGCERKGKTKGKFV